VFTVVGDHTEQVLTFKTFSLWLHISAIVVWVGGLSAISFVFVPVLRSGIESPHHAARLVATVLHRFQRVSREIIFLVFLTGVFNLINAGVARSFDFTPTYLKLVGVKVVLFVVIIVIQAWHSFRVAPALVSMTSSMEQAIGPLSADVRRLQHRAMWMSILSTVLAVSVILLGLQLRYY